MFKIKSNKKRKITYKLIESNDPPIVDNLLSLIELAQKNIKYPNINMKILYDIFPQLLELNKIIGMEKLKETIFNQIIYYIQRLDKADNKNINQDYLHTVITGSPGCGKTTIAKIIGKIYCNLGILSSKNIFRIAKRDDFIAEYLGQTAIKTKKLLNSCLGGVLFIDEIYALGPGQQDKDSFSKEAIDTLNVFLSENKNNFCCIIAGYEHLINKCFFSVNPGLERRFQWIHNIQSYTSENLSDIFYKMMKEINWYTNIEKKELISIIKNNYKLFQHYGGSVENFLYKCKISHSKRVFMLDDKHKFVLITDDILNGIKLMKDNKLNNTDTNPDLFMYL